MGRPKLPRGDLIIDGFSECARRVYRHTRSSGWNWMVCVDASGTMTVSTSSEVRSVNVLRTQWVGTYNRTTQINDIEDDLLERLRELTRAITEQAA